MTDESLPEEPLETPENEPTETSEDESTTQPAAADLGKFDPPREFEHGDEFLPQPPRPIPKRLRSGSYATKQRGIAWTLIVVGTACVAFYPLPFVQKLSYYILPLGYLHWLGYGLLAIAAFVYLKYLFAPQRFQYVKDGIPVVGRILSIGETMHGTADMPMFRTAANVEYRDPDTGEMRQAQIESEDSWGVKEREKMELTVAPGDYVTLVGLPGNFHNSLKIYGMLGLDPQREFLLKSGRPMRGLSSLAILTICIAVVGGFSLLLMGLTTLFFFFPTGGDWKVGIIPGALGAVVGLGGGWLLHRAEEKSQKSNGSGLGCLMIGGVFVGIIGGILTLFILNATLDNSPAEYRPIEVVEFWETTHSGVFRNYEIEYRPFGAVKTDKVPATHEQMERFQNEFGVIEIGDGRFGLPYVRGIHPLTWDEEELKPPQDGQPKPEGRYLWVNFKNPVTGKESIMLLKPKIELDDGTRIDPPDQLIELAIKRGQDLLERLNPDALKPEDNATRQPADDGKTADEKPPE